VVIEQGGHVDGFTEYRVERRAELGFLRLLGELSPLRQRRLCEFLDLVVHDCVSLF
jgi:hypothetical protein